jgi:anaerobic selenocysteine-containing dehydrogenase
VLLPGVTFAEKTGTFTNTERRIQIVRQAIEPLGEALPDWSITAILPGSNPLPKEGQPSLAPFSGWNIQIRSKS